VAVAVVAVVAEAMAGVVVVVAVVVEAVVEVVAAVEIMVEASVTVVVVAVVVVSVPPTPTRGAQRGLFEGLHIGIGCPCVFVLLIFLGPMSIGTDLNSFEKIQLSRRTHVCVMYLRRRRWLQKLWRTQCQRQA